MRWTDIIVRHSGYADPVIHEKKRQRNQLLLTRELAERPNDPFIYYYLGTLAFERKQWRRKAAGLRYILSLAKWGTRESIACKLFAMIAWTNLGDIMALRYALNRRRTRAFTISSPMATFGSARR